jgi:hypothetical protein
MWNIFLYKEPYSGGIIHYYYDTFLKSVVYYATSKQEEPDTSKQGKLFDSNLIDVLQGYLSVLKRVSPSNNKEYFRVLSLYRDIQIDSINS